MSDDRLHVSVHGPGVSIESAVEVAEAMKKLLGAVAENMGAPVSEWEIASIQFMCDGCGSTRPDKPGKDEGWTFRDGDDLCPQCALASSRPEEYAE